MLKALCLKIRLGLQAKFIRRNLKLLNSEEKAYLQANYYTDQYYFLINRTFLLFQDK